MHTPEQLNNPLAVAGDEDMVLGFKALGFNTYPIKTDSDLTAVFDKIEKDKIAVCLIQESLYRKAEDKIKNYKYTPFPVFIPFAKNKTDVLDKIIRGIRLKATGVL